MKTIDQLTKGALLTLQLPIHYYTQMLYHGVRCVETEVELDSYTTPKRDSVTLDANLEADLPAGIDYVVNVGYNKAGHLVLISRKDSLQNLASGEEIISDILLPYTNYYFDNFVNSYGEHMGKYFGMASDTGAYYNIRGGKILAGNFFQEGDTLYLDSISSTTVKSSTVVDSRFEEMVIAYMIYKFTQWSPRFNLTQKETFKRQYAAERRKSRARVFAKSKQEWLDIFRVNTHMSQKA
jgi:hypothetical protein